MESQGLFNFLGLDKDNFEIIIIKSKLKAPESRKDNIEKEIHVEKQPESFYIDKHADNLIKHNKFEKETLPKLPEYIKLDDDSMKKLETFLEQSKQESRYFKSDEKEPGEITHEDVNYVTRYCKLCRSISHNTDDCYNMCRMNLCKRNSNIHFKNNCPNERPCTICKSHSHYGFKCHDLCKFKFCTYRNKKYHNKWDCGNY